MSNQVSNSCWPLKMPPTPKAVLMSLADNADDAGACWPSIQTICQRTCFSERAVQSAIQWLETHGAVSADRSNGRHTKYRVTAMSYKPPQLPHPRTSRTPADGALNPRTSRTHPRSSRAKPPQEVPSNHQEPSITRKAHTGDVCDSAPASDDLTADERAAVHPYLQSAPEGLSARVLADFLAYRKTTKRPMTLKGWPGVLSALDVLVKDGVKPDASLTHCMAAGLSMPADPRKKHGRAPQANTTHASDDFSQVNYGPGTAPSELPAFLQQPGNQ